MAEPIEGGIPPIQGAEGQTPGQLTPQGSGVENAHPRGQGVDQWDVESFKQRADQAENFGQQMDPNKDTEEAKKTWGFFDKPPVDKEALNTLSALGEEDRANIARGAREYMKDLLGVKDTAELDPQARESVQAMIDFIKDAGKYQGETTLAEQAYRKISPSPNPGAQPPGATPPQKP